MNIDLLIKMANEIGEFFAGTAEPEEAARAVANHLKRYWEPRMRAQMLAYYVQRHGAGLSDLARSAVALLAAGTGGSAAGSAPPLPAGPGSGAPSPGTKA
jgi:formate dehydrogenase subunit delta